MAGAHGRLPNLPWYSMHMNEAATRKDIDEVLSVMRDLTEQFDSRFNKIEYEIIDLKDEVVILKDEVVILKNSHNRLLNTIDSFIGRIDKYETELAARDRQFERLLDWARKVSDKTGIPLENL